jgi:hypothetical protein
MTASAPYRQPGDDLDDVVRPLRVAIALNQRVGELMRVESFIPGSDAFANRLGELGQIYPEVWANLDGARARLARRGITIEAFDALRASAAARSPAVLDVETTGNRLAGREQSVTLNTPGHAAATKACDLLRAALPSVDWDALDRADAELLAAAGSLGPAPWKKVAFYAAMGILAALALAMYLYYRLSVRARSAAVAEGLASGVTSPA